MTAINANDQAVRIWMLAGTNQVYSNFANVAAVAASSTAMSAVAASSTAMTAVAASDTAMTAINASDLALNALYASSLVQKYSRVAGWSANPQIVRNGAGLFVRYTQSDNASNWEDNHASGHYIRFDGVAATLTSTTTDLPYNFTQVGAKFGRVPARKFNTSFAFYDFNAIELAYIPL
jgi:hypothetical protein